MDVNSDHPGTPRPGHSPSAITILAALAVIYTLYLAKTLLMPMVVALLLSLLLSPLVSALKELYIPRTVSAILLLSALVGPFSLLAMELAEPAQKWARRIPEITTQVNEQIKEIQAVIQPKTASEETVSDANREKRFSFFGLFSDQDDAPAALTPTDKPDAVSDTLMQSGLNVIMSVLMATPLIIAQIGTTLILILFLLIFGPKLFKVAIHTFPQIRDKPRSIALVGTLQSELSRYIVTVSLINTGLGLATAGVLYLMGVEDALLWGVMVGLLNFAPYIGPLVGVGILSLAGLTQYGLDWGALLPALVYFTINMVEAQFITPTLLGRHMRLNPLLLMVWLFLWAWLWGVVGALLAVPLLVCLKLVASQLGVFPHWLTLIETRA